MILKTLGSSTTPASCESSYSSCSSRDSTFLLIKVYCRNWSPPTVVMVTVQVRQLTEQVQVLSQHAAFYRVWFRSVKVTVYHKRISPLWSEEVGELAFSG